jgi:hypothetical protein
MWSSVLAKPIYMLTLKAFEGVSGWGISSATP